MQVKPIKTIKTMKTIKTGIDYTATVKVSQEMMDKLQKDPEAQKVLVDELKAAIMACFPREDAVQEVMDPTKVQIR